VDYFSIKMLNAIGTVATSSGNTTAAIQDCERSGGTSPTCALFIRPLPYSNTSPANFPILIVDDPVNIAEQFTHGIDVEADYAVDLARMSKGLFGRFDFRLFYSYQPEMSARAFPGQPLIDSAGAQVLVANRATARLTYTSGPLAAGWQTRYSGRVSRGSGNPVQNFAGDTLPAIYYHDLSLSYHFGPGGHDLQAFLTVNNLLDQKPRISPTVTLTGLAGFGNPVVPGDDVLGRYYTAGIRWRY
jgi:outer membrane receptor protein involved in Fe transport